MVATRLQSRRRCGDVLEKLVTITVIQKSGSLLRKTGELKTS
jgi:hypothetical protein